MGGYVLARLRKGVVVIDIESTGGWIGKMPFVYVGRSYEVGGRA